MVEQFPRKRPRGVPVARGHDRDLRERPEDPQVLRRLGTAAVLSRVHATVAATEVDDESGPGYPVPELLEGPF